MKKLLISAVILLKTCSVATAQTNVSIVDYDYNVSGISVGASSYIGLNVTMNTQDSCLVYLINNSTPDNNLDTCHNRIKLGVYTASQIDAMPSYVYNTSNNYQANKLSFVVPFCVHGTYKVKVHGYGNCLGSGVVNVVIENTLGIKKYNEEIKYDYYYFDMGLYKIKINLQTKEKTIVE